MLSTVTVLRCASSMLCSCERQVNVGEWKTWIQVTSTTSDVRSRRRTAHRDVNFIAAVTEGLVKQG